MGVRKVRTQAGADFYGLPIGSTITDDAEDNACQCAVVSLVRLRSIQRQMMQAERVGDYEKAREIQSQLSQEFSKYAKGRGVMQSIYEVLEFEETDAIKKID